MISLIYVFHILCRAGLKLKIILFQSPMYESEVSQRLVQPGVAVGLAWTPMGGEILFVEASSMPGEGTLTLTGILISLIFPQTRTIGKTLTGCLQTLKAYRIYPKYWDMLCTYYTMS